jgi:hypothetical protein
MGRSLESGSGADVAHLVERELPKLEVAGSSPVVRFDLSLVGGIGRRVLRRSRWFARRLWLIAAAEAALTTRRHWRRLDPDERARFIELVRKSRGRPSKLSKREADELRILLEKLGHIELAGNVASIIIPFRPVGRTIEFALRRRDRNKRP